MVHIHARNAAAIGVCCFPGVALIRDLWIKTYLAAEEEKKERKKAQLVSKPVSHFGKNEAKKFFGKNGSNCVSMTPLRGTISPESVFRNPLNARFRAKESVEDSSIEINCTVARKATDHNWLFHRSKRRRTCTYELAGRNETNVSLEIYGAC